MIVKKTAEIAKFNLRTDPSFCETFALTRRDIKFVDAMEFTYL